MTDTPIIDMAVHAACNVQELGYTDDAVRRVTAALRAALPWDLPPERLEAMSKAAWQYDTYREMAIAAYRADPLMRELYPEKFEG